MSQSSPNEDLKHFKVFINIKCVNSNIQSSNEAQVHLNLIGNDIKVTLYALAEQGSSNETIQESQKVTVTLLELEALL